MLIHAVSSWLKCSQYNGVPLARRYVTLAHQNLFIPPLSPFKLTEAALTKAADRGRGDKTWNAFSVCKVTK